MGRGEMRERRRGGASSRCREGGGGGGGGKGGEGGGGGTRTHGVGGLLWAARALAHHFFTTKRGPVFSSVWSTSMLVSSAIAPAPASRGLCCRHSPDRAATEWGAGGPCAPSHPLGNSSPKV